LAKGLGQESDADVRANLPAELVPLFNRVRAGIRGGPRTSRTEAFLKYVEEHPREAYADSDDATDALIADLERQQRGGRRDASRSGLRPDTPTPPHGFASQNRGRRAGRMHRRRRRA
jgi:hypothetical protein